MERLTYRFAILAALLSITGYSQAQVIVRGPLAYDHQVKPGAVLSQEFDIENSGDETMTARLYQTDYSFAADGSNDYGQPGTVPRSNADWVRFTPSLATLEPGQTTTVRYTVALPDSVSGTYWSMLMIESQPGDPIETSAGRRGSVGLRQVTRYGIQIATHVQDSGITLIDFANGSLVSGPDGPVLLIDVLNTGERMLRPELTLRLVDENGNEHGPFTASARRLYPGTSIRESIPLLDVPSGQYSAILVADAGDDDVFGLQMDLTL